MLFIFLVHKKFSKRKKYEEKLKNISQKNTKLVKRLQNKNGNLLL